MMQKEKHKSGKKRERLKRVLAALAALLLIGILTEQIIEYHERKIYGPIGDIYTINGHDMHIWSDGAGDETVVFSSGWGMPCPYTDFYPLHNAISRSTAVAVYDRPGQGWSEVADTPRDIDIIVEELHQLLTDSGQTAPYILVAHSIGSLEVLRFAQQYPDEVKGVVLIDGSYPGMYEHITTSQMGYFLADVKNRALWGINKLGITRLLFSTVYPYEASPLSSGRADLDGMPEELIDLEKAMYFRTFYNSNQIDERNNKHDNAGIVMDAGSIGDIPLIVFTSEVMESYEESSANQKRILEMSSRSEQIILDGALHHAHWYYPDIIAEEILKLAK